ncbi:hypothetical protein DSM03_106172 [Leeuwenhoekiella aestuarii]|uniref:Uncharacterized protein n=1 Tax=Leeuwenhoekiella aestuarii TaxID=2249426 RepID=A0A4Q0NQN8_9FLAO|nr:hypothetical protein [Leeuwenhoekiella aestuarii]RXG12402.1 hypothetical protein DSM04_107173 [Leeuwenhoekiella aestuarii]RXG13834.1 hypothetical protein DSM03_106172 [Leeuwenhoekiella aestuarii]
MKKIVTAAFILCSTFSFSQKVKLTNTETTDKTILQLKNRKIVDSVSQVKEPLKTEYLSEKADSTSVTNTIKKVLVFNNLMWYSQSVQVNDLGSNAQNIKKQPTSKQVPEHLNLDDQVATTKKDSLYKKKNFAKMPRGF